MGQNAWDMKLCTLFLVVSLFLVVWPGAPSSVRVPNSDGLPKSDTSAGLDPKELLLAAVMVRFSESLKGSREEER